MFWRTHGNLNIRPKLLEDLLQSGRVLWCLLRYTVLCETQGPKITMAAMYNTHDVMPTAHDVMHTTYDVMHTTNDMMYNTHGVMHTTHEVIHTTQGVMYCIHRKKRFASFPSPAGMSLPNSP